jgi:hypothetical protein
MIIILHWVKYSSKNLNIGKYNNNVIGWDKRNGTTKRGKIRRGILFSLLLISVYF